MNKILIITLLLTGISNFNCDAGPGLNYLADSVPGWNYLASWVRTEEKQIDVLLRKIIYITAEIKSVASKGYYKEIKNEAPSNTLERKTIMETTAAVADALYTLAYMSMLDENSPFHKSLVLKDVLEIRDNIISKMYKTQKDKTNTDLMKQIEDHKKWLSDRKNK